MHKLKPTSSNNVEVYDSKMGRPFKALFMKVNYVSCIYSSENIYSKMKTVIFVHSIASVNLHLQLGTPGFQWIETPQTIAFAIATEREYYP